MLPSNSCCSQCNNCNQEPEYDCPCKSTIEDNPSGNFCTNSCATCRIHGYKIEPMQTDNDSESELAANTSMVSNVSITPGNQCPDTWLKLLQNGVNNISFNQVIGNKNEPLYTVLVFFPDKLQVTIDTTLVTTATVQTFVHSNKIIITGQKLECSTMNDVAGCKEVEVSRTIMMPLPMKHTETKATVVEMANIYVLLVNWDLPF